MSRLSYSIKNARVSLLFHLVLLVLNFFSRRVFIAVLGEDIVGVTTSVQSYIGMLNMADLGISAAVAAVLYAPLFRADRQQVTEIVSIYGYLFRWVGIIIASAGVLLSLFLPLLFANDSVEISVVYMAFYTFLVITVLSYIVNYKQHLLVANQKNYVVISTLNTITVIKIIVQISLLKWFNQGYATWLAIELAAAISFAIFLEWRVNREYPWLKSNIKQGRSLLKKYPEITRNIRQMFSHKVAGYAQQQSAPIIVQIILGVKMVTHYTNYVMLSSRLIQIIVSTLTSNTAGVGNLIAEGDQKKIKLVFWQMNAMFYWIGGTVAFAFFTFVTPLVKLWIPDAMLLSQGVVLLISFNLFVYIVRQPVIYFVNGYGIFSDTWAAWCEAILCLALSVILTIKFGIIGVVAGGAISAMLIVMLWRPHYLYKRGFNENSGLEYWVGMVKYILLTALVWIGCQYLNCWIFPQQPDSWGTLIINGLVLTPIYALVLGSIMWVTSRGMRTFVKLLVDILKRGCRCK